MRRILAWFAGLNSRLQLQITEREGRKAYWALRAYGVSRRGAARVVIAFAAIPATDAHGRRFRLGMLREALADTVD